MRRRRQQDDDLHNKERWLISYADFITLLFAFFVVMYSVSSVNEGKYKVLSETLTGVFNAPQRSFQPIEVGDQPRRSTPQAAEDVINPPVTEAPQNPSMSAEGRTEALRAMADQLALEFDELINQGVVTLETSDEWLELSLRNSLLFGSGDAEPHYDAFDVVEKIAAVLRNRDNAIRVEGFTDNRPINTVPSPPTGSCPLRDQRRLCACCRWRVLRPNGWPLLVTVSTNRWPATIPRKAAVAIDAWSC